MKIIVANWKMNPQTIEEARQLASQIERGLLGVDRNKVETIICPPAVFIPAVRHLIDFAKLGAQNVSRESAGAFTGEISARQLAEFGVEYVIVGHSERRRMGGDDKVINRKIKQSLAEKLKPILCVGFGTKKSDSHTQIKNVITRQIKIGLAGAKQSRITIAYEPVWAISQGLGTGKAATPAHAAEIAKFIKLIVNRVLVLYGGSVDGKNAAEFAAEKIIDGALVGGASLVPLEFLKIIRAFANT